jgi:hypothetical protein
MATHPRKAKTDDANASPESGPEVSSAAVQIVSRVLHQTTSPISRQEPEFRDERSVAMTKLTTVRAT